MAEDSRRSPGTLTQTAKPSSPNPKVEGFQKGKALLFTNLNPGKVLFYIVFYFLYLKRKQIVRLWKESERQKREGDDHQGLMG